MTLYDSSPPNAQQIQACHVKISYKTLPCTAGFLPVFPDARGAKVAAMFFTLLSAAFVAPVVSVPLDESGLATSVEPTYHIPVTLRKRLYHVIKSSSIAGVFVRRWIISHSVVGRQARNQRWVTPIIWDEGNATQSKQMNRQKL